MNTNLHPVFAAVTASMMHGAVAASDAIVSAERAAYARRLQAHDWDHTLSEDDDAYRRGRDDRAALRALQSRLDGDFAVWNTHAPLRYRNGRP